MRFAYIDSQGNEISIPSVDALELRIELGAIGPDTELYDAQADRWGPARTHDIYKTLARDTESEGFVAPPPPAPPSGASEPKPPSADEAKPASIDPPGPPGGKEPFFDLAAEILDPGERWAPSDEASAPAPADDAGEGLDLDFTLVDVPGERSPPAHRPPEPDSQEPVAESPGAEPAPDAIPVAELGPDADPTSAALPTGSTIGASDLADDLEIDLPFEAMDLSGVAPADDLHLEGPLTAFEAEPPPAWLEHEGAWSDDPDDVMDFSRVRYAEEAEGPSATPRADQRDRERRVPRTRPSPPRRTRPGGVMRVGSAVLVTVGVVWAGWALWQRFGPASAGSAAATAGPELPPVTLPDLPEELVPSYGALGDAALSATVDALAALQQEFGLAAEPRSDWLAGTYLANASEYADIQRYWEGLGAYVAHVREVDRDVFRGEFRTRLEQAAVAPDAAAILSERADSGFLSTRAGREGAYRQMEDLVGAALALHEFLLENEGSITHEPAAGGVSRDPVLEAVPATPELGSRMWDMVDRITEALDALGSLDRVTTQRLLGVLLDRVREAGLN